MFYNCSLDVCDVGIFRIYNIWYLVVSYVPKIFDYY